VVLLQRFWRRFLWHQHSRREQAVWLASRRVARLRLQAWWRGIVARRRFANARGSAKHIQAFVRRWLALRRQDRARWNAAIHIQRCWRRALHARATWASLLEAQWWSRNCDVSGLPCRWRRHTWSNKGTVQSGGLAAIAHRASLSALSTGTPSKTIARASCRGPSFAQALRQPFDDGGDRPTTPLTKRSHSAARQLRTDVASEKAIIVRARSAKKITVPSCMPTETSTDVAESILSTALREGLLSTLQCTAGSEPHIAGARMDRFRQQAQLLFDSMAIGSNRPRCFFAGVGAHASVYEAVHATYRAPEERLLWHGTSWRSLLNILRHGFNRAYSGRHGSKFGVGTYFAMDPEYALRFSGRVPPRVLILACVLVGRYTKGSAGIVEPPLIGEEDACRTKSLGSGGRRYDSTVDDSQNPRVFCVFRDFQALPVGLAVLS